MEYEFPLGVPAWTPMQRQVLARLGMQVWLRRSAAPVPAADGPTVPAPERAAAAPRPRATQHRPAAPSREHQPVAPDAPVTRAAAPAAGPSYDLAFTHLGNLLLVVDRCGEGTQHLARDLALVIGSRARAPRPIRLEWPGNAPASLAADPAAARQAAEGLLDRLLEETRPALAVACGPAAVAMLLPDADPEAVSGQSERRGLPWLWVRGVRTDGGAKRQLWLHLQPHVDSLRQAAQASPT